MTRKRETSLKSSTIHDDKEKYYKSKTKTILDTSTKSHQLIKEEAERGGEDVAVRRWLADRIKDKLQRASILSLHTRKPIVLYRKSIEENESAVEEEISYVTGNHIVHMIYAYGGFIPSSFRTIEVFTLDKFTKRILQERKKDLLLQYFDGLEQLF